MVFLVPFETPSAGRFPRDWRTFYYQIITMADSGLDVNSCFFSEDQSEDNIECSTYANPVFDLTKRKVCFTQANWL